jgi:Zn-dependent metalloprotease
VYLHCREKLKKEEWGMKNTVLTSALALAVLSTSVLAADFDDYLKGQKKPSDLITNKGATELVQSRSHQSPLGSSIRYRHEIDGAIVEDSELALIFDKEGNLVSQNSTLKTIESKSLPKAIVSPEAAMKTAAKSLRVSRAALKKNKVKIKKSLKYNADKGLYFWDFRLSGTHAAFKVKVAASGPLAGNVLENNPIYHDFDSDISVHDGTIYPFGALGILLLGKNGRKVYENGEKIGVGKITVGKRVKAAYNNFKSIEDFYFDTFGRKGFDNEGHKVKVFVNVNRGNLFNILKFRQNAAWVGEDVKMFMLGGGGKDLKKFERSLDVIGHEYTHAVIDSTSQLKYEKQSGALNEHLADMFGIFFEQSIEQREKPFLIGEDVLTKRIKEEKEVEALRDMENPEKGLSKQPTTMASYDSSCVPSRDNDNCGVHKWSSIPNMVGVNIIKKIGWEKARNLYYRVMTDRLVSSSTFKDYKKQVIEECALQLEDADCADVKAAFKTVGI